jgi:hypothetical protein
MSALIPYVAGTALLTFFSGALLALPPVLGALRLIRARLMAPFARDALERNLVLAAALAGAVGAVVCADGVALGDARWPNVTCELAAFLQGFVAPAPLAAVPWVAGELLSGPSLHRWRSLFASLATSCAISWGLFAWTWPGEARADLSPEVAIIQLAASAVTALAAGYAYLALRGEPSVALPLEAVKLERLA